MANRPIIPEEEEKKWENPKDPEAPSDQRDQEQVKRQQEQAKRNNENLTKNTDQEQKS